MKIYVIGNGFDLAHQLKTSYQDYRTFIKEHANGDNKWGAILEYYPEPHEFWSDAETAICKINRDRFLEFKKAFGFSDLDRLHEKIHDSFEAFIVEAEAQILRTKPKFTIDKNAFFLSFNYTNLLEHVYGVHATRVIHLHNNANGAVMHRLFQLDADDIVLGHGPDPRHFFFYQDMQIGGDPDYIRFRNQTQKNTEEIIKKHNLEWDLLMRQHSVGEVVFFGFSFSPNDQDYVRLFARCLPYSHTVFRIYYHVRSGEPEEVAREHIRRNMAKSAFDWNRAELIKCNGVYNI